jgi:regulator of protease activity HflC (stomatin/prohibitin superfamily)
MRRNLTRIGWVNLLLLLLGGAVAWIGAQQGPSFAGKAASAFFAIGVVVAILAWFQSRLEEREQLEKLELEELARSARGPTLFDSGASEIYPARRAREQFERFLVPAGTLLVFLLQAAGAIGLWWWLRDPLPARPSQPMLLMSLYGLSSLILFLFGKYSARLAQLEGQRLLRPVAAYVLLGAAVSFLVALGVAAVEAGFPRVDLFLARAFALVLAVLAVETLITLTLELYRPRVQGRVESRVLYEGRLIGLLSQPAGLFSTLAQALDYQFGFKVSDTWFYQFLQRSAAWLVLAQAGLLLLFTCVVFVDSGEQALLERFGRPVAGREILGPGIHFKLPWPADDIHRERTREVRTFLVGIVEEEDPRRRVDHQTMLWTVPHAMEEYNLLVASRERYGTSNEEGEQAAPPVSLLTVNIPVQFEIADLRAWATQHAHATNLLEKLATREVVKYLIGVDLFEFMSIGRDAAASELKDNIQKAATDANLGVNILFVGLQGVHPPVAVGKEFNAVAAALQEKEAIIERARAYAITNVILARAHSLQTVQQADAYRVQVVSDHFARAAQFTNQVKAFQSSPEVFTQRSYLGTLSRGAAGSRKIVLTATNAPQVLNLNLEDKLRTDLLDVTVRPRNP